MTPATVDRMFYPLLSGSEVFSTEPISESEFLRRGFRISESKDHGRYGLLSNGNTVADLFDNREELDEHIKRFSLSPLSWSAAMFLGWTFV